MKRINIETGYPYRMGDYCKDKNMFFRCYRKNRVLENGFYGEFWLSKEAFDNYVKSQKEAANTIYKKRSSKNREYVNKYKLKNGCSLCGYNKHHAALDFDHIDRSSKDFNISSRVQSISLKALKDEIKKCIILCANCHREKSFENKDHKPINSREFLKKNNYHNGNRFDDSFSKLTDPNVKSGVKNVYITKHGKYIVRKSINGVRVGLGVFNNIFDACCLAIKIVDKNGIEDLKKAQFYQNKLIELESDDAI